MEFIDKINKLYHEINKIYQQLCNLENNGDKDNAYYLELVRVLKIKILIEKSLCNQLIVSLNDYEFDNLFNKLEDNDSFFGERLIDYLKFHNDFDTEIYEEDDDETIENINYMKLLGICYRNIYLVYLSFLQEYISAYSFYDLKEKMLGFKYYNSFRIHDIESMFVGNNFEMPKTNYINMYFLADTLNIDNELRENTIFSCYYDVITTTISQILSINDIEYSDDSKRAILINNQCMLRAALSIIGETEYEKVKNDIYEYINELSNSKNRVGVMIINSILDYRKKDRSRVKKISMRPQD